jgi:DDB1- and CUL4-associated factor 11
MDEQLDNAGEHGYEGGYNAAGYGGFGTRRRRRPTNFEDKYPKVPSEEGRALMRCGSYGSRDDFADIRRRRKNNISERLMWRQLGIKPRGSHRRANHLISQA